MTETPITGRCLCGGVTIELVPERPGVDVCHCDMCRRWSGGPFFSLHGVKEGAFVLSSAENVATYRSSEWAERAFCKACGSNLWYRFLPGEHVSFLAGLFQLPADWCVDEQIFVDEAPGWAELAADSPKKTGAEVIAEAKAAGYDFG